MGKFKAGEPRPANAGRKPGTPNKRTEKILELFEDNEFCPGQKLIDLLNDKDTAEQFIPTELCNIYLKLMEFKFPRRKATELTGKGGTDLFSELIKEVHGK